MSDMDSLLDILSNFVWTENGCSLSKFISKNRESLPQIVRVLEGFLGEESSATLDTDQILILHNTHKETKILAKDSQNRDLFIPKNFQVKVEMVPSKASEEYSSVRELLRTFPQYFRVLDDINTDTYGVLSGTVYKVIRQKGYNNYLECIQMENGVEKEEARLPLHLEGRFQPLQDAREFFIDEIFTTEDNGFPVCVRFVKSSNLYIAGHQSLHDLGNILLIGECETETVHATVLGQQEKILAAFPWNLNVEILAVETQGEIYERLRQTISEQEARNLKRMTRLDKMNIYFADRPLRQFSEDVLLPPSLPCFRTPRVHQHGEGVTQSVDNATQVTQPVGNASTVTQPTGCRNEATQPTSIGIVTQPVTNTSFLEDPTEGDSPPKGGPPRTRPVPLPRTTIKATRASEKPSIPPRPSFINAKARIPRRQVKSYEPPAPLPDKTAPPLSYESSPLLSGDNATPPSSDNGTPPLSNNATPPLSSNGTPPLSDNATPPLSNNATPPLSNNATPSLSNNATPPLSNNATPPLSNNATPSLSNNATPPLSNNAPPHLPDETPPFLSGDASPPLPDAKAPPLPDRAPIPPPRRRRRRCKSAPIISNNTYNVDDLYERMDGGVPPGDASDEDDTLDYGYERMEVVCLKNVLNKSGNRSASMKTHSSKNRHSSVSRDQRHSSPAPSENIYAEPGRVHDNVGGQITSQNLSSTNNNAVNRVQSNVQGKTNDICKELAVL
ncbi:uncharacterized protein LOC116614084 [Nematostella vectensis]|uniref:uncharacterized protein LOC116614084 n=1 Tax=Nematostella vectensis TaxID=45351 RepID=UPI0020775E87|nr:uncharacterized protein LOC116614084 [Nematostella vectensis]